jgi:single-stranded DNA-binding protein
MTEIVADTMTMLSSKRPEEQQQSGSQETRPGVQEESSQGDTRSDDLPF